MNRLSRIFFSALALILVSCSRIDRIDERLDSLDTRVSTLQSRINTNIDALSQAIKAIGEQDYIVSTEPVLEEGQVIGYNICMAKGSSLTIYFGAKGDKGEKGETGDDGADGAIPQVGVKEDSDGCWYWTLNGDWMTQDDGSRIKAVGKDGLSGNIPQLKIEDDWWKLSYDGGHTWTALNKATGEDGKDSDPMISSVEYTEIGMTILLADGSSIVLPSKASHDKQIEILDSLNNQLKAMQAIVEAITNADYVTSVNNTEEGCLIVFKNFGPVLIPAGADGNKGEQGETGDKGHSPQISVATAEDGLWYWKADGQWLLSPEGEKIPVAGQAGADGENGVAPQTEIRDGKWYISFDGGETWAYAGISDGTDADGLFIRVDTSDEKKIVFFLSDGTSFTVPTYAAFSELERVCNRLNDNLESLATLIDVLENRDYITAITGIYESGEQVGYSISFNKAETISVYDGKDCPVSAIPSISVAIDPDGVWCWQVGGEWLLDSKGNRIRYLGKDGENGLAPKMYIENGKWYISYGGGTPQELGQADGEDGLPGDYLFSSVDVKGNEVIFNLSSGTSFTVNRMVPLDITFSDEMPVLYAGDSIDLTFEVSSASEDISIDVFTTGDVKARRASGDSSEGVIHIQAGSSFDDYCKVVVLVTDGRQVVMKTITFEGAKIVVSSSASVNGISGDGGTAELSFLSNTDYELLIPSELNWVSLVETRTMTDRGMTLRFSKNNAYARSGELTIRSKVDKESVVKFKVSQKEASSLASQRKALKDMYSSLSGSSWTSKTGWNSDDKPFESWFGLTTDSNHNVTGIDLHSNKLSGSLPSSLGNLTYLNSLKLQNNKITGSLPESFAAIMTAQDGKYLDVRISGNRMSGSIPASVLNHKKFASLAGALLENQQSGYGFSISQIPAVSDTYSNLSGSTTNLSNVYSSNLYTLIFRWAEWSEDAKAQVSTVEQLRKSYEYLGLGIIGAYAGGDRSAASTYLSSSPMADWTHIIECKSSGTYTPSTDYPLIWESSGTRTLPFFEIVDSNGNIVFISDESDNYSSLSVAGKNSNLSTFVAKLFEGVHYTSKDYSKDGVVTTLQTATEGNGINLILMGDAFSDRLIADGTYAAHMNTLMEDFFSVEPYTSFRKLFNVYAINVVSENEEFFDGSVTALETSFGDGTRVSGNDATAFNYAENAISTAQLADALVIVLINRVYYAGTCYMYYNFNGDYGRGKSVAYYPLGTSKTGMTSRAALTHHEAGGHGFSKLADEYAYTSQGAITISEKLQRQAMEPYGWWKNIDFTSDPEQVKWAKYLSDSRYSGQGLGVYEGGLTYISGVWRSTSASIMKSNTGGYNAPSREAIYYRIHKLAYGSDWTYNHEAFVAWDLSKASSYTAENAFDDSEREDFIPLAPPVIIFEE